MMECSFHLDNGEPGVPVLWLMLDTYCFLFRYREAFRNVFHTRNDFYVIVRLFYIIESEPPGWAL
jgi:hypothetical protein